MGKFGGTILNGQIDYLYRLMLRSDYPLGADREPGAAPTPAGRRNQKNGEKAPLRHPLPSDLTQRLGSQNLHGQVPELSVQFNVAAD